MRRSFFAPEVIQSSAIDCAPAALKSVLEGFGICASYERLREACQTDVDGTSVAALERAAQDLGLDAQQVWLPVDHLTSGPVPAAPCLLVVQLASGISHIIVVWRRLGPLYQIMDPADGRRWVTAAELTAMAFEHDIYVYDHVWQQFARGPAFQRTLRARLTAVGGDPSLLVAATQSNSRTALAALDAALRMLEALIGERGLRRGASSRSLLELFYRQAQAELEHGPAQRLVPDAFHAALPLPSGAVNEVRLRGAIAVRLLGQATSTSEPGTPATHWKSAVNPKTMLPWAVLWDAVRQEGARALLTVIAASGLAAALTPMEAVLAGSMLQLGVHLQPLGRAVAAAAFLGFLLLASGLEWWSLNSLRALGRRFELRIRARFLAQLPRLGDLYFRSRPMADLAHRAHTLHPIRELPAVWGRLLRLEMELMVVMAGLICLDPQGAAWVVVASLACVLLPRLAQSPLSALDSRVQTYEGSLAQYALDALLGLSCVKAHGAERAVRWEHDAIVLHWARASRAWLRVSVWVDLVEVGCSAGLCALLVMRFALSGRSAAVLLLYAYWALSLPFIGQQLAFVARQLPRLKNLLAAALVPLEQPAEPAARAATGAAPVKVEFDGVTVQATGQPILSQVDLRIEPGEHVAIVGQSGAGKSSLLELLLGWKVPAHGAVRVDGELLTAQRLVDLRASIAWVDPSTTLWNRSLLENLRYGTDAGSPVQPVLEQAELIELLERLGDGLQSSLGEAGRLLSGGEGQRVRLARAQLRPHVGLVLLDEAFRGLDRPSRRRLLGRARELWAHATLLCVTHDIADTLDFDRVVVVEGGRVVEQGRPHQLLDEPEGRLAALVEAERTARREVWGSPHWRRLMVSQGTVHES